MDKKAGGVQCKTGYAVGKRAVSHVDFWPGNETETSVTKADISTNSFGISDGDGEKEERKNKSPKDKDDQSSQYEKDKPNNEIIQAWKKAGEMLMPNGDSSNIQSLVAAITGGAKDLAQRLLVRRI